MKAYRSDDGTFHRTQAEAIQYARNKGSGWKGVDIPTTAQALVDYLNEVREKTERLPAPEVPGRVSVPGEVYQEDTRGIPVQKVHGTAHKDPNAELAARTFIQQASPTQLGGILSHATARLHHFIQQADLPVEDI